MNAIPTASMALVWERASGRCEYCRLHNSDDTLTFHVDHIIPKQHGGTDDIANLCLACSHCNWQKGPNLAGLSKGKVYLLFNPRRQNWNRHFEWVQSILVGKTETGTATIQVLDINGIEQVIRREALLLEGRFPPDDN
jgi:hypothetical protein